MKQLCIDVGGTFTDCLVLREDGKLGKYKAATTPDDPTQGFFAAVTKAAKAEGASLQEFLADVEMVVHGTTLGTNILVTGTGAKVGMLTTEGFRDVVEMRRGIRNVSGSMFDQFHAPYEPLVPRHLRLGAPERALYTGEVDRPLDEDATREAVRRLVEEGCEAIAICFLHSYVNPANELRAKEIVREEAPGVHVATSHEILPVWREFERFSTTVVSAFIGPKVESYLQKLATDLEANGFDGQLLMMLVSGLVQFLEACIDRAVYLLGSGPAAAPAAARYVGELHGRTNILSADMGGTSFDVCLIRDGEIPTTSDAWVDEERVAVKMVDITSIGAGGGSIAWIDSLGLLRVGPQSAGADPGPAAYGKGKDATVTDADLLLGYVSPEYFLGGEMSLDMHRAAEAVERIGQQLGLDLDGTARAIYATATALMADSMTELYTKKGHDVRDFTMVAGGGAGGVHAAAIARQLGIREVIIPRTAALMSAFGMFTMDLGQEHSRSRFSRSQRHDAEELQALLDEMRGEAQAAFDRIGASFDKLHFSPSAEIRYAGQFHEIEVQVPDAKLTTESLDDLVATFHDEYHKLFGYSMPWLPVELMTFHLKSTTGRTKLDLRTEDGTSADSAEEARKGERSCLLDIGWVAAPVYDAQLLGPGHRVEGPAIIEDPTTTILVLERSSAIVDDYGNLIMTLEPVEDAVPARVASAGKEA